MDTSSLVLFFCAGLVATLFVFNLYHTWKHKKPVPAVTVALYVVAVITVLFNMYQVYMAGKDNTLMVANGIALVCILITAWRSLKR